VGVCATSGSVPASDGQDKVTDRQKNLLFSRQYFRKLDQGPN
jgi:hypothetical protein